MSPSSPQNSGAAEASQISQLLAGFITSQAIAVAAKLGIADLLEGGPRTIDDLAKATKAHVQSLHRILRMLTSVGIFAEDEPGRFRQTALSELLRSDHPRSARGMAILWGSSIIQKPSMELHRAVMTGVPAANHVFGAPIFEYLGAHPEDAAVFNAAMTSGSAMLVSDVVAAYDFSRFDQIVDVGGGHGLLLHAILSANPKLRGVLADLPAVVAGAEALRSEQIAARCEIVGGDFFASVPAGADAYIMKWVIHDWNDEDCLKILRNCRRAIRREGRLLIVDAVLTPCNEPDPGKLTDLLMLMMASGGRERTEVEFRDLLRRADFLLTRLITTASGSSIIESQPA